MSSGGYTFPFSTCEKPNKNGIAQPYSTLFNLINCFIIFYFLLKTKQNYTFILLFFILCFELFHVFSHSIHIPGSIQINITHLLSYCINFAFLFFFYNYVKILPSIWFLLYYLFLIFFDIYTFCNMNVVYYIFSQALLFLSVLFYYYPLLNKTIENKLNIIFFLVILIILLFLNEKYNCEKMMSIYPDFPYHIFIETIGIILFYIICSTFYKL
jgi:hypothetical protein